MGKMDGDLERMDDEGFTISMDVSVNLKDLATSLSHQANDGEVVEFLKLLDGKMANWEFTEAAAALFVGKMSHLYRDDDGNHPRQQFILARVSEFLRQLKLSPMVDATDVFYGTWTDPNALYASLLVSDLEQLVELAAFGLAHLPKEGLDG
jgi:hypothetical protein